MSQKPYAQIVAEERRLLILQLLEATKPDYCANSHNLREGLASLTHKLSRDQIHTELAWLAEQGLLAVDTAGPVVIATLSSRGLDVAQGTSSVPGVKRKTAID